MTRIFLDSAYTTRCCDEAAEVVQRHLTSDYANPSSSHGMGQDSAKTIREARRFFSKTFQVAPEQVIFTGSGSESDNLAIQGVDLEHLTNFLSQGMLPEKRPRLIYSAIEHPAVAETMESLKDFGFEV